MNREELLKNAKPILFNTKMVQAILEGRKTVTRRKIDRDITNFCDVEVDGTLLDYQNCHGDFISPIDLCRYKAGDILYVREKFNAEETDSVLYAADKEFIDFINNNQPAIKKMEKILGNMRHIEENQNKRMYKPRVMTEKEWEGA